jgi:predicted ATP-grasp superfamily ATP-dependent carboligase
VGTFVLQFNRGHSGNSTYFIKLKKDLEKLARLYPNREAKISEYIKGKTYTLNCLVLGNGEVLTGSISEQITGLKSATNNPNTTCGNDFDSPKKLHRRTIKSIQKIAENTGKFLHKHKYRGFFGIDVIIENNTNNAYFIELNTHQPASISFEAKLHRDIGKAPLIAQFILDKKLKTLPIILPFPAKQVIYRNKTNKILKYSDIKRRAGEAGLISRMKFIKPNEEIYRVQTK